SLKVQDDLRNVFLDACYRGKLMLHAFDAHAGNRGARKRGKQHAAKRVAQRLAKAALQRLDDEPAVILAGLYLLDLRLFEFGYAHGSNPPSETVDVCSGND